MSDNTPRLGLPELAQMQEMDSAQINDALVQMDALSDVCLLGQFANTPPTSPNDGDTWLTGGAPTGGWSGYAYKLAYCIDGGWQFFNPWNGLTAYLTGGSYIVYQNGAWTDLNALIGGAEQAIASAATCDIGDAGALVLQVTGTTAITSFGTAVGRLRLLRFGQALTLTHDATALALLGGASRVTAANDVGIYRSDGSGNWRELAYFRAASNPGDYATKTGAETFTNKTLTAPALASPAVSGTMTLPGSSSFTSSGQLLLGSAAQAAQSGGASVTPSFQNNAVGTNGSSVMVSRWGASAMAPRFIMGKSRGAAVGTQGALSAADGIGLLSFAGSDGSNLVEGATIGAVCAATPATGVMPASLQFSTTPSGGSLSLRTTIDSAGNLIHAGAAAIGSSSAPAVTLDVNGPMAPKSYTIATLPAASAKAGQIVYASDLGGGGALVQSDGAGWKRMGADGFETQTIATGSATLATLTNAVSQFCNTALTGAVTLTLSTTNATKGARFRIIRGAGASGASTLSVVGATTKALAVSQWVEFGFDGTAWQQTAFGSL